jgi:hypothetical protein
MLGTCSGVRMGPVAGCCAAGCCCCDWGVAWAAGCEEFRAGVSCTGAAEATPERPAQNKMLARAEKRRRFKTTRCSSTQVAILPAISFKTVIFTLWESTARVNRRSGLAFARARWSDLSSNIVEAENSLVATERGRGRGLRGLLLCLSQTGLKRRANFRCPVLKKMPLHG